MEFFLLLYTHTLTHTLPIFVHAYNAHHAQVAEKDAELKQNLKDKLEALDKLWGEKKIGSGPYLLGDNLSLAEIAIFPFIERFVHTLAHYRNFKIFSDCSLPNLSAAFAAAKERPAFQKTTAEGAFFVQAYKGYATKA